jgi:hypothetical protein
LLSIFFLVIEILIALFVNDQIIRPYFGDMLVVILMYCFVRSFILLPINYTILMVLGIAFIVEVSQYLNLIKLLGLENSTPARIILGNTFSFEDMGMYLLGGFLIWVTERLIRNRYYSKGLHGF